MSLRGDGGRRRRLGAGLALLPLLLPAACMLMPLAFAADPETRGGECRDGVIDELNNRSFRLYRIRGDVNETRGVTLRIAPNCEIDTPDGLQALGVVALRIRSPRSASRATLVLETELRDGRDEPVCCTAPLVEVGPMDLVCPPEAGGVRYRLEPLQ